MKSVKWWLIAIIAALLIIPAGWLLVVHLEGGEPKISKTAPDTLGGARTFNVSLQDEKSGLRNVRVILEKDGSQWTLLEKDFPKAGVVGGGSVHEAVVEISAKVEDLGISDGEALLRITARDYSWRDWRRGNKSTVEKKLLIDSKSPDVEILSRAHNVSQGGAGVVIYRLSEPCPKSGVLVGNNYFPGHSGYFKDDDIHLAFFALAFNQEVGTEILLEAVDGASNKTSVGFYHYLKKKNFKKDSIKLSDRFLNWKMPEFKINAPNKTGNPMLDKFLAVNSQLRLENGKFLSSLGLMTEPVMHWDGEFIRLPNSARRASFADHRDYYYNGEVVDRQVHLGIDLASLEKSPIPAANAGKVVFADYVGIYGKTVVIDHGFGLMSLYSHLSGIDVEPGQMAAKGQVIGKTGITGLAGGDHLHFGMMIHDTMVNPVEWWDSNWIINNVLDKLEDARQFDKP
jgi:murein DD-endopeptidase MepM/ murein hydrolase activator NlpD